MCEYVPVQFYVYFKTFKSAKSFTSKLLEINTNSYNVHREHINISKYYFIH